MPIQSTQQTAADTKQKKRKGTLLWVLLAFFILLFLLSTVVLASRLYELATRDKYAVDLHIGGDSGLTLFKIEYQNETGEITVQGSNGEDLVAPGTAVDYDIRLRNSDDVAIDFVLLPSVRYLTEDPIPLQVKLVDNYGNYLLGSDTEWVGIDSLNGIAHKGTVREGEVYSYYLSWQWAFESGDDAYDTYLGNREGAVLPGVEVSFLTESTANPNPAQRHTGLHLLDGSFGCCWCCWFVWLLLLAVVLLLVWIGRQRKQLRQQEDALEEYELQLRAHGINLETVK